MATEVAPGLLSGGSSSVPAVAAATAEERARRSVGMRAILESLDLSRTSAELEAALEARVDASRRAAIERAVAWEIEDEVAVKTGRARRGPRADLAASLDALEVSLDRVGAWLSRNEGDLEGVESAVAEIVDDNASLETTRANLGALDGALARLAAPAAAPDGDGEEDGDDDDGAPRGLALAPADAALLGDPFAALRAAAGREDELRWDLRRAATAWAAASRNAAAVAADGKYAGLGAVAERTRALAALGDAFEAGAARAVGERLRAAAYRRADAASDDPSTTASAAAIATSLRRRQTEAHEAARSDGVAGLLDALEVMGRTAALQRSRRRWADATRDAPRGIRPTVFGVPLPTLRLYKSNSFPAASWDRPVLGSP